MPSLARITALALAAAAAARSQEPVWILPPGGAAVYQRTSEWNAGAPDDSLAVSLGGHPDRVQPVLFERDLDRGRIGRAYTPYDLYDLLPYLAFDLGTSAGAGALEYRFPSVLPYGDVIARGRVTALGADSQQTMHLRLSRGVADEDGLLPDDFRRRVRVYLGESLEGELVLRRKVDRQRGLVTGFRAELSVRFSFTAGEAKRAGRVHGSETWSLMKVTTPGSGFDADVESARGRGIAWLKQLLAAHEDPVLLMAEGAGTVQGPTHHALLLLALARAGVSRADPVVAASLGRLWVRQFGNPNSLSLAILMTEAFATPSGERARLRRGARDSAPRELDSDDRRRVRRWVRALLAARDRSREAVGVARWFFTPRDGIWDDQTTWLAVQALHAAHRCGIEVPDALWTEAAVHLLATRLPLDAELELELLPEGDDEAVRTSPMFGSRFDVPLGGWTDYMGIVPEDAHGAVTAGVVGALGACRSMLTGARHAELRQRIDDAMWSGLAWLAAHHSLRFNPSLMPALWQFDTDHLLAMSTLGEQLGIRTIQGRDWYFEGAQLLMAMQAPDGQFPGDATGTAVGVMFLRPASD